jgi:putative tricarboxylic transport membrane protein
MEFQAMQNSLVRSVLPYVVGLGIAIALYISAGQFEYSAREGQLGPGAWPRLAILLLGASCLFELGRRLIAGNRDATGFIEVFDREPDAAEPEPTYPGLLIGGVVLMGIYAVAVPYLGFILGTFLFLAAFMYVGRFRDHRVIWGASFLVTVLCGVLFLRIAYVSLPRGIAPFDRITDIFFLIPGI